MFYLPSTVWHGLNSKAGVDADNILTAAVTLATVDTTETSEWVLRLVINQIHRFLDIRRQYRPRTLDNNSTKRMVAKISKPISSRYLILIGRGLAKMIVGRSHLQNALEYNHFSRTACVFSSPTTIHSWHH